MERSLSPSRRRSAAERPPSAQCPLRVQRLGSHGRGELRPLRRVHRDPARARNVLGKPLDLVEGRGGGGGPPFRGSPRGGGRGGGPPAPRAAPGGGSPRFQRPE